MTEFRPDRIENERLKEGWTQELVAEKIGVARSTYGNYEAGKREPDLKVLKNLAKLFDVSTDYLIGNSDSRNPINNNPKNDMMLAALEKLTEAQLEHILKTIELIKSK